MASPQLPPKMAGAMSYRQTEDEEIVVTTIAIRRSGGASIVSLPKTVIEMMHLSVGSTLDLTIEEGKIVLTPSKDDLTLEQLLEGCTRETFAMTEEEREWHDMKPIGREII